MPTNLYGPGDNYDLQGSHVLPAFIAKIHQAKVSGAETMEIWGSGTPQREFLHVDDLAEASLFLIRNDFSEIPHNIGSGQEVTIRQLAETIAEVLEYKGRFVFDSTKPDGMPRKLCDTSKINAMGWRARIGLKDGIAHAYQWFLDHRVG
jgi:GDP-L-fucose synthase